MRWPVLALLVACTVAPIACSATADNATAEAMRKVIDDVAGPEEMQSLLNWALEHSDPAKLRRMAAAAPGSNDSEESLEASRVKVQGLLEDMAAWPTEAELVQQSLSTVHNKSASEAERVVALKLLQELVEQVDIANDFLEMNATVGPSSAGHEAQTVPALEVVSQVLLEGGEVRLLALKVMAVAASNNVPFQRSVLRDQELIVPFLVEMLVDVGLGDVSDANTTAAALHALGALTRNLPVNETRLLSPLEDASSGSPNVLNLLFALAHRFWPETNSGMACGSLRVCSQIVQRSTGLLQDLAVSNPIVRDTLRQSSSAAAAWIALCHKTSWERIDKLDRHLSLLQAVVGSSISGVDDGSEAGGGADVAWSKALPCLRNLENSGKTQPQDDFVEGVRGSLQRSIRTLENGSRRVDSARLEDL